MKAVRLTTSLALATVLALGSTASARDRASNGHHHGASHHGWHYGGHYHGGNHHLRRNRLALIQPYSLGGASRTVSVRQPLNPPSSGWSSIQNRNVAFLYDNGTSIIYRDETGDAIDRSTARIAPKAKIIQVTEELADGSFKANDGCSYELGVCVIRGGN